MDKSVLNLLTKCFWGALKDWGNILKKRGQYSKILSSEEVEAEARNGAKRNVGPKPQPSRRIIFLNIVRVF